MSAQEKIHNRLIHVVESEQESDQIDFVKLRRKPHHGIHQRQSRISLVLSRARKSWMYIKEQTLDAGALSFMTVKVVLWDVILSGADVLSDFAQGLALYKANRAFGVASLAINWIPGLAAAIQLISKYRNDLPVHKVFMYALLLLLFYPIVPLFAYFYLLYKKPKSSYESVSDDFVNAQYNIIVIQAITGGLESPIQLIFQMWLVLNGVLVLGWDNLSSLTITDLEGNTINLQFTASLCIIFSVISILKSMVSFNVAKIHDGSWRSSWSGLAQSIPIYLDFVPYLASGAFFRIASVIAIMVFFNIMGFIPVGLMLIANFVINQTTMRQDMGNIPHWLIMFMSLFVPACFSIKKSEKLIDIQKRAFFWQSLASLVIYGASLITVLVLVNDPNSGFRYSEDLSLNNQHLNIYIGAVLTMGILNCALSTSPKCSDWLKCCQVKPSQDVSQDVIDSINNGAFATIFKLFWIILTIILVCILPLLLSWFIMNHAMTGYPGPAYVYYKPRINETRTVQAVALHPFNRTVEGFMKPFIGPAELAKTSSGKKTNKTMTRRQTDILVIKRQDWTDHKEDILSEEVMPLGIIIINNDHYRPSSPFPDVLSGLEDLPMPVLLVRQEDIAHFFDDSNDDFKHLMALWITPEFPGEHSDPEWSCDSKDKCLEPILNQGFPQGAQYRTFTCHWGGEPCSNVNNDQQFAHFCNGSDIQLCPLDSQGYGNFKSYLIQGKSRIVRSSPPFIESIAKKVQECGWSGWLEWQIESQNGGKVHKSRRRFCLQFEDCIIEEKQELDCCFGCSDLPNC